jgi:hypothetical protein
VKSRFGGLVLSESPTALPEDGRAAEILAAATAAERLPEVLPLDDPAARCFLDRVACLREGMPDLGLPETGDAEFR